MSRPQMFHESLLMVCSINNNILPYILSMLESTSTPWTVLLTHFVSSENSGQHSPVAFIAFPDMTSVLAIADCLSYWMQFPAPPSKRNKQKNSAPPTNMTRSREALIANLSTWVVFGYRSYRQPCERFGCLDRGLALQKLGKPPKF